MKKLFLLSIGAVMSICAFAQSAAVINRAIVPKQHASLSSVNRLTSYSDTDVMSNGNYGNASDTNTLYYFSLGGTATDSGFFSGTNAFGFSEYAERYEFSSADSTVSIVGVLSLFAGTVSSTSTKNVVFYAWNVGSPLSLSATFQYSGFPGTGLDSVSVPFLDLGINSVADTFKAALFATPTAYLSSSFFVGYTVNYNWATMGGDTIGVQQTYQNERTTPVATIASGDTTINDQDVAYLPLESSWFDYAYDIGINSDFYMFPIVIANVTSGVNGVTRNNLTFFGNYPNPANDNTNIKFSLANSTDVTITIMDMTGHTINSMNETNLAAGVNIIPVNTSNMPSGDYLYLVRTAAGDGIASKMTVIR